MCYFVWINLILSKTKSLENLLFNVSGYLFNPNSIAFIPKLCGMLE